MSEEQNKTYDENGLQWTVWICPNFENNESIAIFKAHHVISDGMGIMLLFGTLQDNYSPSQFVQTTEVLNCCKKFILYLLKPLTLMYAFLWFFIWSTDENCIKGPKIRLAGKKNNAICKPFDLQTMKRIGAHYNKATINDVVLSLLSVSIREYMRNHEDMTAKSINMLVPYSLREVPKRKEDHRIENDFSCLCFTLKLCATFSDAIAIVQK